MRNPPSSASDDDSRVPKSARPPDTQVERGDPLGDPRRVVERRRRLHDAVAEADALRALRDRGEEHLGRARVAVLLEEVVLDLPHVVDAEPVGELALLERVLDQRGTRSLRSHGPGSWCS